MGLSCRSVLHGCPCGYYGHPEKECSCTPHTINRYMGKISGPLLDRIDMYIQVPALPIRELITETASGERSSVIRKRVQRARLHQMERLKNEGSFSRKNMLLTNACLSPKQIKKYCSISQECKELIACVIRRFSLSARAYDRILKVSRTIADLAQSETIQLPHIAEAIQYRNFDKNYIN